MKREEIERIVNEILVDELGVEPDAINAGARFKEDLNGDSLDCVELIMSFEYEFDVIIKDEDAEKCDTVKDMYDLIDELV